MWSLQPDVSLSHSLSVSLSIYIYIYIYVYTSVHVNSVLAQLAEQRNLLRVQ